ncbi:hypothetical protein D6C84_08554 [Aureobasidium pullulans]|uniref:Uncharacterized protein n=1 Tax=Aureobasidium pullulans TaxID=5580 RepID=A0A4S9XDC6_AURPU|nr:hypothetical protein D6D26_06847 [Aureobasidium pullulans]THW25926.1 hypothetical protein D6D23_03921 [Aureobasidium pullulans]THW60263.1 hypothetical protein D6D20_05907 [Aureobasidium pullulans]THY18983.1 hypothetical protein D6D00_07871 [Aureobasidium pullulans]THZ70477.1 hypothetical protein D6C85_05921 [Aureobasidium pullulans]
MSSKIDALNDLPMHQHHVGLEDNIYISIQEQGEAHDGITWRPDIGILNSNLPSQLNLHIVFTPKDKNAIKSLPFNDEAAAVTAQSFAVQITGWRLVDHAGRPSFAAVRDSISIKLLCPSSYTRQTLERGLPGQLRIKTTNLAEFP